MENQNAKSGSSLILIARIACAIILLGSIGAIGEIRNGKITALSIGFPLLSVAIIVFWIYRLIQKRRQQNERENAPVDDRYHNAQPAAETIRQPVPAFSAADDNWPEDYNPSAVECADAEKYFLRNLPYHRKQEQYTKYLRACDPNTSGTIVRIDPHKKAAAIQSSKGTGIYNTSLYSCTCVDYQRNHGAPCKHIYKLALELGIIPLRWDVSGLPDDVLEKVQQLKPTQAAALIRIMEENKKPDPFFIAKRKLPSALIKLGFFVEMQLYDKILDACYTNAEIREAFGAHGIKTGGKKKADLIQEVVTNYPEIAQSLCSQYYMVQYAEFALDERDGIIWYLTANAAT